MFLHTPHTNHQRQAAEKTSRDVTEQMSQDYYFE